MSRNFVRVVHGRIEIVHQFDDGRQHIMLMVDPMVALAIGHTMVAAAHSLGARPVGSGVELTYS